MSPVFDGLPGPVPPQVFCPLCGEALPHPEVGKGGVVIDAAEEHLRRHPPAEWFPAMAVQQEHLAATHQQINTNANVAADLARIIAVLMDRAGAHEMVLDRDVVGLRAPAEVWMFDHAPDTVMVRA